MADLWTQIRTEYATTDATMRDLAQKYGVNERTLFRRSKKEDWVGLRQQTVKRVSARCQREAENQAVKDVTRMIRATDLLLKKAEQLLEIEDALAPRDLRSLASTLLDVRTMLGIRDELDRTEQQTRIEKMRAEIAAMNEEQTHQNRVEVVWVSNPWDTEDDDAAGAE